MARIERPAAPFTLCLSPLSQLFMDYGVEWEEAWNEHVRTWSPPPGSDAYVYAQDMDLTEPFRTVDEQQENPYPSNLMTVYAVGDDWPERLAVCHILSRERDADTDQYIYNVAWSYSDVFEDTNFEDAIPHAAISFVDRPNMSDQFLEGAFRHPIGFPDDMTPDIWRQQTAH